MKNTTRAYFVLLTLILMSFKGVGQNREIVSETNEFDYLIGMEYSDVKELNALVYQTRTSMVDADKETSSTNFTKGPYQIITSEIVRYEPKTLRKLYKIQDIIVLNGSYALCEGCLTSEIKGITIKSIHEKGKKKSESILVAFEKSDLTGIYTQVDTNKYEWNQKSSLLKKY